MFASLSRRSSKVTRSYICSSCLCNILISPIAPTLLNRPSAARQALFSTTAATHSQDGEQSTNATPDAAPAPAPAPVKEAAELLQPLDSSNVKIRKLKRRPVPRRASSRRVLDSNATLEALRDSLEAEESKQNLEEPVEGSKKRRRTRKHLKPVAGSNIIVKASRKSLGFEEQEQNTPESGTEADKSSKVKAKAKSTKAKKKTVQPTTIKEEGIVEETGSASEMPPIKIRKMSKKKTKRATPGPRKKLSKGASTDTAASSVVKITKIPSTIKPGIRPFSEDISRAVERRRLVKSIQEGNLSEAEKRNVLRSLRNSLITRVDSDAARRGPIGQGIKAAMLRPGVRRKTAQPPQPYLQKRIGIEVPYKVGAPRAGNRAPISRAAPGPITNALPPTHLRSSMTAHEIETVEADALELTPIDAGPLDVPKLAYGLERVLFNPGVYQLQDPRTRVFNFDPYLQTIMPVDEFDFNALKEYLTSSRDDTLLKKAAEEKKKYTGSTSSMTSALGHFHFLLSQWRLINVGNLSKMFPVQFHTFTSFQRVPISIFLRWKDGTYAIDADKQFDGANVLSMLGKSMEKFLTLPTEHFEKYRKGKSDQITEEERNEPEAFHYTTMGDFLMRSQLDAYDSRLPGTGMFDLKTRAVVSVRMDTDGYEEGRGYQIRQRHGEWESFEREYYDMIRSAFLKYSLQVRMGRMDGIFVAFHNTERIFGFQYISLEEMDYAIHGTNDKRLGDAEFKLSVDLLNRVLDRATAKYPEKSLRIHFETRDAVTPFMYIFAEPVEESRIDEIQASNAEKVEEFEKRVLGLDKEELDQKKKQAQWDELRAQVEKAMEQDEHDPERSVEELEDGDEMTEEERHQIQALVSSNSVTEDLQKEEEKEEEGNEGLVDEEIDELEEDFEESAESASNVTENGEIMEEEDVEAVAEETPREDSTPIAESKQGQDTPDSNVSADLEEVDIEEIAAEDPVEAENFIDEDADEDVEEEAGDEIKVDEAEITEDCPSRDILAMTLTIQNKVDGKYVAQPDTENYPPGSKWEVEYALAEVQEPSRAEMLYKACRLRRKKIFSRTLDITTDMFQDQFLAKIKSLSREGREWRDQQTKIEEDLPVKTLNQKQGVNAKSETLKEKPGSETVVEDSEKDDVLQGGEKLE